MNQHVHDWSPLSNGRMCDSCGDIETWAEPNKIRFGGRTPRPHRHAWAETLEPGDHTYEAPSSTAPCIRCGIVGSRGHMVFTRSCTLCGKVDDGSARRGRNNRKRGNKIELEVARALGLRKVGMYGGPEDAGDRDSPFLVQVKSRSGSSFPGWMDDELAKLPVTAQQTPLLAIAEAGVVGKRRRTLIVLRLEDWKALHGE